jgi:hypothetical protein
MKRKIKQFKLIILTITLIAFNIIGNLSAQDIHIKQSTTWSTNQNPTGNIIIENGATLTISSGVNVNMPGNSYIIVNQECKLIATNATFSGPASWFGIYAHGYGLSYDQVSFFNPNGEHQPEIILEKCTLNYMQAGINNADHLFSNPPEASSGGILKIKDCVFNDCVIGVRVSCFHHMRSQNNIYARELSYVYNSKFIISSSFTNIQYGIVLEDIIGMRVYGNYFYSANKSIIGVWADNATFSIDDYYTGVPVNPVFVSSSKFENCLNSVKIDGSNAVLGKCLIRNTEFLNNVVAVNAISADNIEVYSNTVEIDQTGSSPYNGKQVGIYFDNCATFYCENNNISTKLNIPTIPVNKIYGIVVHNCGENNNKVYRNTVNNCGYNIDGQEHNRGSLPQTGLQYICNNLIQTNPIGSDNTYYMACLTSQPTNSLHGINEWQTGGAFDAIANVFISNSSAYNEIPDRNLPIGAKNDFYNEHKRSPYDIHYKNPINKYPLTQVLESNTLSPTYEYYGDEIWVADESQQFSNQCPNQVPEMYPNLTTLNTITAQLQSLKVSYSQLKTTFAAFENNGDYQFMLDQVNNLDNTNYTIVYYYLMNYHPSTDVLAIAVANDDLPNYMCSDVLVTNSYGIKSQLVRDALSTRQSQLTSSQMTSIYNAAQTQSQYETYLAEMATLRTQINTLSTSKYNYYFNIYSDEVETNEVISTLVDNQNFYSFVSLMMYYFDLGDVNTADQYFNEAMNADEVSDLETINLSRLYNILLIIYDQLGGDFTLLDPAEIQNLESIAETSSKSGGIAKTILMRYFEHEFDPILLEATQNSLRFSKTDTSCTSLTNSSLRIVPNPADEFIGLIIDDNLQYPLQLKAFDMSGKKVLDIKIENKITINVDQLKPGLYHINVIDANQKSFNQQLIIK